MSDHCQKQTTGKTCALCTKMAECICVMCDRSVCLSCMSSEKHRCSLHVTDDGKPYGMASPIVTVDMDSIIDGETVVAEFFSFDITGYINP